MLAGNLAAIAVVHAQPDFLDAAFGAVWTQSDLPVERGTVKRSYLWGPALFVAPDGPKLPHTEPYRDFEGGQRTVQYFEKGRMELTTVENGRVTAGLLVREMISGQIQVGMTQSQPYSPSGVPVAGDTQNNAAPSFAALANVATLMPDLHTAPNHTGGMVDGALDGSGKPIPLMGVSDPTTYAYWVRETQHNIATPFWDYLNQRGPIISQDGKTTTGSLFPSPFFAVGLPITEPYWIRATVGGVSRDVLMQAFERRVLTYTPANPDGFKVEMGNVGAAYARWRYGPVADAIPAATVEPTSSATGSLLLFTAPGFTPDEVVVLRLTAPDGKTTEKPGGTANAVGITRATLETNAKDYPPGQYKVNLIGTKSNQTRPGTFALTAPPANGLIVQALPGSGGDPLTVFTLYVSGLSPGESVSAWISGPTGTAFTFNGDRMQTATDRGTILQTIIPKSLTVDNLIGPWAFVVQESGANARQGNVPFLVNAPPRAGI